MGDRAECLALLARLASEDFVVPEGLDPWDFGWRHLDLLGDLDPQVRDAWFLEMLWTWIQAGIFSREQIKALFSRLTSDDFLFLEIDDPESLAVYRRTFSILVVGAILDRHRQTTIFAPEEFGEIQSLLRRYVRHERHVEGHHPTYGWAHSVAHTADALGALGACAEVDRGGLEEILLSVEDLLVKGDRRYAYHEDSRLARTVRAVLCREVLSPHDLEIWLHDLVSRHPRRLSEMETYARWINVLDFLRSLYFYVRSDGYRDLAHAIERRVGEGMQIA